MDWRETDPPEARYFPWDRVRAAWNRVDVNLGDIPVRTAKELFLDQASRCQTCGRNPEELLWLCMATPDETWVNDEGRAGWLTICEGCATQVDFIFDEDITELRNQGNW